MSNRDRLEKLLGMLGSEHEGERAAAALKISDMAKAARVTIPKLIQTEFKGAPSFMDDRPSQADIIAVLRKLPIYGMQASDLVIVQNLASKEAANRVWPEHWYQQAVAIIRKYGTQKVS